MAIGCEDVSARMMELLYGELGGEDRAAVEAHLGGCASCRAELAAFQGTRAAARRALDADAPPARVHDAILRAAAAAVATKKPRPMQARPTTARPSFWERLRRRWTLPTFATVGAVAVVVLASKVFLEPDKTVELGRQTVAPAARQAPRAQAIAEAPEPTTPAPTATAAPAEKTLAKETADREKSGKREISKHAAAPHHSAAKASSSGPGIAVGGLGAADRAPKGGGRDRGHQDISDNALDGLIDEGANSDKSFRAAPAAKPAKREFAPPPPPRAQPPSAPAAPASEPRVLEGEDDALEASPRRRVGGAGAPGGAAGPPPAAHASPKRKKAVEEDEMESATADEEENAPAPPAEKRRAPAKDDKPAATSPVAQADRLFAEGRWAEAARAYRELLRSDPRNADAGRWRQRLTAAEAEMAPPTHAASKKAAPP